MAYGDGSTKLGSYTYDTAGNISSAVGDGRTISYTYDNTDWVDLLTSVTYNGTKKSITYDGSGNPMNWYNGTVYTALTWTQGRRLSSLKKGSTSISYAYDMDGVRTTKIAGNEKHEYVTQNGKVVRELVTNKTTGAFIRCLDFLYDESGKPFAMRRYWDASLSSYGTYHYVLNAQGDVVQINYQGGEVKATYTYDAWGRVLTADGELAAMNPIRYRGYYYDTDTGFYYLQSRYYDPIIKRFLNADSYESTGQGFVGTNMFAYCNNNPVIYADTNGHTVESVIAEGSNEYYVNGFIITIDVEIIAKIPLSEHASVTFSENSFQYSVEIGGDHFNYQLSGEYSASKRGVKGIWSTYSSGLRFSIDLEDGLSVGKTMTLTENIDMNIKVSVTDAAWYDDALNFVNKLTRYASSGGYGAGLHNAYASGGGVYISGCGLGGGLTLTFGRFVALIM